jgi:hypothetical protein
MKMKVLASMLLLLTPTGVLPLKVGDPVCTTGIAMDYFCISRGFLFDNPSIATLKGPNEHSVHCLIEVDECIASHYEILLAPKAGSSLYTRGYRLDNKAKANLFTVAKRVGVCGSCDDRGTVVKGLTVKVQGKVVAAATGDFPPTITGNVTHSTGGNNCVVKRCRRRGNRCGPVNKCCRGLTCRRIPNQNGTRRCK